MTEELTNQSASRLAEMVRRREVSPVELVEAHLERIARVNPKLNAVVTLSARALEDAAKAEEVLMKGGTPGALAGVPVTVKETIDVGGLRSTAGARTRAERVPARDAPAVARLRAAGAIILGKTNCAELALDYTAENPLFGRTNNPHDLGRTPGGSSGGCAAAVGARLTAASLGSDLAGSVRIPAHFCGVVGFRPSGASVPREGHCPPVVGAYTLGASLGPITRTVADARLLYRVLSGLPAGDGALDEADGRRRAALEGVRVAWYEDDGEAPVSDEVRAAVRRAASACESAGMVASAERPPHVGAGHDLWLALFAHATQRFVAAEFGGREDEAGPVAISLIERGKAAGRQTDAEFLSASARRERMRSELLEWMKRTPLVLAPVGPVAAFRHEESRRIEIGGRAVNTFRAFGGAQAFNVFDLPTISVPAGRTKKGLPVGVQLACRPGDEELLFAAARIIEGALGGWLPPSENPPQFAGISV
jgi:Asp-tRNA(Asn)/Glu-tRNA(Gln) amidotransferase A subunit family amidase